MKRHDVAAAAWRGLTRLHRVVQGCYRSRGLVSTAKLTIKAVRIIPASNVSVLPRRPFRQDRRAPRPRPPTSAPRGRLYDVAVTTAILLATFLVGLVGGYVASLLKFPLPYMTGSLLITAALGLAGVPVRSLWQARAAGQFVTGAAVGTTFTPAIMLTILHAPAGDGARIAAFPSASPWAAR